MIASSRFFAGAMAARAGGAGSNSDEIGTPSASASRSATSMVVFDHLPFSSREIVSTAKDARSASCGCVSPASFRSARTRLPNCETTERRRGIGADGCCERLS